MIKTILFDLDGTLLDTADDLTYALNQVRILQGMSTLSKDIIRPMINFGSRRMLKVALQLDEDDQNFAFLREKFLFYYEKHIADRTQLFPGIEPLLQYLQEAKMPWGIVTNKLTRYTHLVLEALNFKTPTGCVVCGDTLMRAKPHPDPILHACQLLNANPKECLYVGDAKTDVLASRAAGTSSLVALYGYIDHAEDPKIWGADGYISSPHEIIDWLHRAK